MTENSTKRPTDHRTAYLRAKAAVAEALEVVDVPETPEGDVDYDTETPGVALVRAWAALGDVDQAGEPDDRFGAEVQIPGIVTAEYVGTPDGGEITRLAFYPSASDAGYFGPAASVYEASEEEGYGLNVKDTEGPFWKAVQRYLSDTAGALPPEAARVLTWEE